MAFCFGVLDIVWMLFTFYGMRRYRVFQNGFGLTLGSRNEDDSAGNDVIHANGNTSNNGNGKGALGGKAALVLVILTHFAAAFATVPNRVMAINGCVIALPSLAIVVLLTVAGFWFFCKESYLPEGQRQRIRQARHLD